MVNFFIVCTGYNCAWNVESCFNSISNQTHTNFQAVMISDGSDDATWRKLSMIKKHPQIKVYNSRQNFGAAFHRYAAITKSNIDAETVIVLLGMDDELMPFALEEIAKQYDAGKWMTYGNWVNHRGFGLPDDFKLEFDERTHAERDYRKVKYRSTGLNTFKKFLFDKIPMTDFIIDGKWIMATTESEIMFSCLEMCGKDRIGIVKKPIVIYNQRNINHNARNRFGSAYQDRIYSIVTNRPKKPLYEHRESIAVL